MPPTQFTQDGLAAQRVTDEAAQPGASGRRKIGGRSLEPDDTAMSRQQQRDLIETQLLEASQSLCPEKNSTPLGTALRRLFPGLAQAFTLYWIPEQAEDIYEVLVSATEIAVIEIVRSQDPGENHVTSLIIGVETYKQRRLSRDIRRKLDVALELMQRPAARA